MAQNNNQNQQQQIAVIQPARMQMPAVAADRYDLNEDTWRALVDAVFPLAKSVGAVMMALAYCEKRNLDIFTKVVHIVPMKVGDREVETVWPGIALHRITAQRQADFWGWDDCEFGPDKTFKFEGQKAKWENGRRSGFEPVKWEWTGPEWARFIFYKKMHGERVSMPGPKTYFVETYAPVSAYCPVPNDRWQRAPRQMLEKNAESSSLRRGWPDVFGDENTFEEVEGQISRGGEPEVQDGEYTEVEEEKTPTRADIKAASEKAKAAPVDPDEQALAEEAQREGEHESASNEGQDLKPDHDDDGVVADESDKWTPEQWEEWRAALTTKIKCAVDMKRFTKVQQDAREHFARAPADIQEQIRALGATRMADLMPEQKGNTDGESQ